jgi:hypothetical protein
MEVAMAMPVPKGEQPKSDVEGCCKSSCQGSPIEHIVEEYWPLVRLQEQVQEVQCSCICPYVLHPEDQLKRSEETCEELAAIKKKSDEAKATQAQRDKD